MVWTCRYDARKVKVLVLKVAGNVKGDKKNCLLLH